MPEGALPEPDVPGVYGTYVGVRAFGPLVRCFRDGLGWQVVGYDRMPASDVLDLWGVDAPAEVLTLAPDADCPSGIVTLLRLPPSHTPPTRGAPSMLDLGDQALSLYTRDTMETVRRLTAAGGRLRGEITQFPVPRGENSTVLLKAALMELPDDLNVLVIEPGDPRPTWTWVRHPQARVTEINFMVRAVPDLSESLAWWTERGLGLPLSHTGRVATDQVAQMTGIAPGAVVHNGITANDVPGRLELTGPPYAPDGLPADATGDRRVVQFPGTSLGQVLWRVVLPARPASFREWAQRRSATVLRMPARRRSPHFADRAVGLLQGPDGQRVQVELPGRGRDHSMTHDEGAAV